MCEQKLVKGAPVLQDHRPERVTAVAFTQTENNIDAAKLLSPTGKGGLGANATKLLRADAQPLVSPDGGREAAHLGDPDTVSDVFHAQGLQSGSAGKTLAQAL